MKKAKPSKKLAQAPRNPEEIMRINKELKDKEEKELQEQQQQLMQMTTTAEDPSTSTSSSQRLKKISATAMNKSSRSGAANSTGKGKSSTGLRRLKKSGGSDDEEDDEEDDEDQGLGSKSNKMNLVESPRYIPQSHEEDVEMDHHQNEDTWKSAARRLEQASMNVEPVMLPMAPSHLNRIAKPPGYYAAKLREKKSNGAFIVQLPTKFPFKERPGAPAAKGRTRSSSTVSVDVKKEEPKHAELGAVSSAGSAGDDQAPPVHASAIDLGAFNTLKHPYILGKPGDKHFGTLRVYKSGKMKIVMNAGTDDEYVAMEFKKGLQNTSLQVLSKYNAHHDGTISKEYIDRVRRNMNCVLVPCINNLLDHQ